jgi:hypothetical protein
LTGEGREVCKTSPDPTTKHPVRLVESLAAFFRLAAASLATSVGLALIGWYPTTALGAPDADRAMWTGIAVALAGGWAGVLAPVAVLGGSAATLAYATLAGLGVRFFVTVTAALVIRKLGSLPVTPLMLWVGLAQLVILAVDMIGLVRIVRKIRPREAA